MGRIKNCSRASVILFKFNNRSGRIIFLKAQNIAEISSAPRINTLPIITNYSNIFVIIH